MRHVKDDFKFRKRYKNRELFRKLARYLYNYYKQDLGKNKSFLCDLLGDHVHPKIHYKNYCFITGRTRGVHSRLGLGRNAIKKFGGMGYIYGLRIFR